MIMRYLIIFLLFLHIGVSAQTPVAGDWSVRLAQGTSKQLSVKPAEVFHLRENDESSSALNAGILGAFGLPFLRQLAPLDSELILGASIAKNNLKSKPQDLRTLNASLRTIWRPFEGREEQGRLQQRLALDNYISYDKEENREKRAKGHKEQFDLSLTGLCPDANYGIGQGGPELACFPYAGLYRRTVSQTGEPLTAPLGNYGGPYAGILLRLSLGKVTPEGMWWTPFILEADAYRVRDTHASGGYVEQHYKYASLTLSYLLYQNENSRWKPKISLVREVGTDRLNNEERTASTKLTLQLSYGL